MPKAIRRGGGIGNVGKGKAIRVLSEVGTEDVGRGTDRLSIELNNRRTNVTRWPSDHLKNI